MAKQIDRFPEVPKDYVAEVMAGAGANQGQDVKTHAGPTAWVFSMLVYGLAGVQGGIFRSRKASGFLVTPAGGTCAGAPLAATGISRIVGLRRDLAAACAGAAGVRVFSIEASRLLGSCA
jgi:hypothetical protein